MPPQPPLLRPLEPLIPFPENSENTLARALSDAAPVHLPSTLEQTPSTLGQASSTLRVPGRLIPLDAVPEQVFASLLRPRAPSCACATPVFARFQAY